MLSRRRAIVATLAGAIGIALAVVVGTRGRTSEPELLAAQAGAAQELDILPDTMVGWDRGPQQPILFSHRRHAGEYQIDCLYCHTNTDRSPYAYMPSLELCMGCHRVVKPGSPEIQKLRGYSERGEPIPWVRIYKLADFVQFRHEPHLRADLECQNCHGNVEETDILYQATPLTMGWCLDCHGEPAEAEQIEQAQRIAQRFAEAGREERGLYPRSIDSDYGVTRGPIDCAACHY